MPRIVTIANRTPSDTAVAGGLAVALKKVLGKRQGFWFGWSGEIADNVGTKATFRTVGDLDVGAINLTRDEHAAYYSGFANRVLWPAFHLRLDLTSIDSSWYAGYRGVNERMAAALLPHLKSDDLIWVHDYHLIPLATMLRAKGVRNRIGFYLHIPFPSPEAFQAVPHNADLLLDLSRYDLVGMQAQRDVTALRSVIDNQPVAAIPGIKHERADFSGVQVDAFPIGSDPDEFARLSRSGAATKMFNRMKKVLGDNQLILGVDRLDYSKGLPQRIAAYEKLMVTVPDLRRKVHLLQIAPSSRETIKEYREISDTLDAACGRVLGRFSEPDWQPLTYIKRAYGQASLAGLYRLSRVGFVTPLRDGMNLVAHEWIASQDPQDPGALILSLFAGAAEIFPDAILVNPFDAEETAQAMKAALAMSRDQRLERWESLMSAARKFSVDNWANAFVEALATIGKRKRATAPVINLDFARGADKRRAPAARTEASGKVRRTTQRA